MNITRPILAFILWVSIVLACQAQEMQAWKWDAFGIGFNIPTDFTVTDKSKAEFAANNGYISISIHPWHDASINADNLADMAVSQALDLGYSEITEFQELELKGFVGYGTTGIRDEIICSLGFLLDSSTETNFVVAICYEEGWDSVASAILASLYNY